MIEFASSCLYLFTTLSFITLNFAFWDALFVFFFLQPTYPDLVEWRRWVSISSFFLFTNMVDDMG